jgi:hypothetical protein
MATHMPWNIYKILNLAAYYKLQNYLQLIYAISITTYHTIQNSQHNTNSTEQILGKWPMWRTILYYVFIFIFNSLHVSSTSCSSSGETNCANTTSGNCYSVSVAVLYTGLKWTSNPHTTRPPTQSNSYQGLCWHKLSLLMISTMCSKHVES